MFQSAPPVKGATPGSCTKCRVQEVSIRAPREGGDSAGFGISVQAYCFNPRPP